LTQVEVDEVLSLVRNVRTEVASDDAVPRRVVLFVEFLLDVRRDILLDVVPQTHSIVNRSCSRRNRRYLTNVSR
jgi:hypothetical protein